MGACTGWPAPSPRLPESTQLRSWLPPQPGGTPRVKRPKGWGSVIPGAPGRLTPPRLTVRTWRNWLAHLPSKQRVAGSSPVVRSTSSSWVRTDAHSLSGIEVSASLGAWQGHPKPALNVVGASPGSPTGRGVWFRTRRLRVRIPLRVREQWCRAHGVYGVANPSAYGESGVCREARAPGQHAGEGCPGGSVKVRPLALFLLLRGRAAHDDPVATTTAARWTTPTPPRPRRADP